VVVDSIAALARREGLNEDDKEKFVVQQVRRTFILLLLLLLLLLLRRRRVLLLNSYWFACLYSNGDSCNFYVNFNELNPRYRLQLLQSSLLKRLAESCECVVLATNQV
jgi:hypothetical protein